VRSKARGKNKHKICADRFKVQRTLEPPPPVLQNTSSELLKPLKPLILFLNHVGLFISANSSNYTKEFQEITL